jgi:hypothetical protein
MCVCNNGQFTERTIGSNNNVRDILDIHPLNVRSMTPASTNAVSTLSPAKAESNITGSDRTSNEIDDLVACHQPLLTRSMYADHSNSAPATIRNNRRNITRTMI